MGKLGRLVIRPSGTEPAIRVMAEEDDAKLIKPVVSTIVHRLTDTILARNFLSETFTSIQKVA
jgi:phosphomannomutase